MYPPQITEVKMHNKAANQISTNTGRKKNRSNTNYSNQQQQNNIKIHPSTHPSSSDFQTNLNPFQQRNAKFKSRSNRRNYRSANHENYYNSNYQNSNIYLTDSKQYSHKYLDNKSDNRFDNNGNKQFYGNYHNQWLDIEQLNTGKIDANKFNKGPFDEFVIEKQIVNKQLNKQFEKEQLERQFYEKKQIDKQNKRLQEIEDAMKESQKNNETNPLSAHHLNQLNTKQLPIDENQINLQNQINARIDEQFKKQQMDNLPNSLISVNSSVNNRSTNRLINDSNLSSTNLSLDKSMNNNMDRSISNSSSKSIDKSFNKPNRAITKHNGNGGLLTNQKLPAGTGSLINGFCTNTNNDLIPINDTHQFNSTDQTNGHYVQHNSQLCNQSINNNNHLANNDDQLSTTNGNQMVNSQLFDQLIKSQLINNPQLYKQLPANFNLTDLMKITDLKSLNKSLEDKLNASLNASKTNQFSLIPNESKIIEFDNNNSLNQLNKSANFCHSNFSKQIIDQNQCPLKNSIELESADDKKINQKQTYFKNNHHQINGQSIIDNRINDQIDQNDSQLIILNSSNSTQQSKNVQKVDQIKPEVKIESEKFNNNKRSNGYFHHNNYKERIYKGEHRTKFHNEYFKQNEYNKQTDSKYRGNHGKCNKTYLNNNNNSNNNNGNNNNGNNNNKNNQLKTANMFPVSHSSSYPKLIHNDIVSSQIWKAFLFLRQTPKSYHRKIELRQILYAALRVHFPNNLYVVGSSLNGLGTNTSDVDMCLLLPDQIGEIDQYAQAIPILKIVQGIVKDLEFVDSNKIKLIEAKVPILKFWDKDDNIEIDLNINNIVGIRNTQLIRCYTKLDWRFQPLAITVKAWAHRNDIKNAYKKTISSYTLVLMLIHYLQVACSPPVLPCLHKLMPSNFQTDSDVRKLSLYEETPEFKSKNDQSLSELFLGFLDYYGNKFDYSQDVISIRQGAIMKKEIAKEFRSSKNTPTQWRFICCEEPFDRTNTARSVSDYESFMRIIGVFRESYTKLKQTGNLLSILNFDHILFNKNSLLQNDNSNSLSMNSLNSDLRSQSTQSIYSTTNSSQSNLLAQNDLISNNHQILNSNNVSQNSTLTQNSNSD